MEVIVQLLRRLAPPFVWVSRDIVQLKTKERTTKQDTFQNTALTTASLRKEIIIETNLFLSYFKIEAVE